MKFTRILALASLICIAAPMAACGDRGTGPPNTAGSLLSSLPASPSAVADNYTFDEEGVIKLNQSVEIGARLGTALVKTGLVKGNDLATARRASKALRTTLETANRAYAAANRSSWIVAVNDLTAIYRDLARIRSKVEGDTS